MKARSAAALCRPVLFFLAALPAVGDEALAAGDPELPLLHAPWSAEAWSHHAAGHLGWLATSDGSLRLELGLEKNGPGPEPLLEQAGEGWTLILGPDGEGTLNAWNREWRKVDPGLGSLAAEAVRFMSRPGEEANRLRVEIPELDTNGDVRGASSGFRGSLVRRGRGRGGPGEVVILERLEPRADSSWAFEIRSTRRPGRLRVAKPGQLTLSCPVPEVFLPLWPLSEICENRHNNPGTSAGADR
jgi:hypothetical protein